MSFIGHCFRSKEVILKLILWEPKCGKNTRGRPARNFINQLTDDTNLDEEDLETTMNDREFGRTKSLKVDCGRHDDDDETMSNFIKKT